MKQGEWSDWKERLKHVEGWIERNSKKWEQDADHATQLILKLTHDVMLLKEQRADLTERVEKLEAQSMVIGPPQEPCITPVDGPDINNYTGREFFSMDPGGSDAWVKWTYGADNEIKILDYGPKPEKDAEWRPSPAGPLPSRVFPVVAAYVPGKPLILQAEDETWNSDLFRDSTLLLNDGDTWIKTSDAILLPENIVSCEVVKTKKPIALDSRDKVILIGKTP